MWKRSIDLKVLDKDTGNVLLATTQHRIDFVYQGQLGWTADRMKVDIYNLAPETLKMMLDTKNRVVQMRVGYEDEPERMSTLLDGYVVNVYGRKAIPNHITSIWCVPHSTNILASNSKLNTLMYESGTLRGLINAISKFAGYKAQPKFFGIDAEILESPILSYIMRDSVGRSLTDLGDQYGFYVRGTNSNIKIISRLNSKNTVKQVAAGEAAVHKMSLNKLKGTPEATICRIDFVMNLDGAIQCGDVADVTAFLGARPDDPNRAQSNGIVSVDNAGDSLYFSDILWQQTIYEQYQILYVTHVGSNYAPAWETRITGVVFNGGLAGGKAVSGNGRGTGTGDVDVTSEVERTQGYNIDQSMATAEPALSDRELRSLNSVKFTPEQDAAISRVSRGNQAKEDWIRRKYRIENRGHDSVQNARSSAGALGPAQIMPDTGRNLGMTINKDQDDRLDFNKSTSAVGKYYDEVKQRYNGNEDAMNADYNGGISAGRAVERGEEAPAKETRDYLRYDRAIRGEQ